MARPAGKKLNGAALRYVLRREGLTMTEAAERCGIALTTLSGLAASDGHGASDKVVRSIVDGLGLDEDALLFPEFAGFRPRERVAV